MQLLGNRVAGACDAWETGPSERWHAANGRQRKERLTERPGREVLIVEMGRGQMVGKKIQRQEDLARLEPKQEWHLLGAWGRETAY